MINELELDIYPEGLSPALKQELTSLISSKDIKMTRTRINGQTFKYEVSAITEKGYQALTAISFKLEA